MTAEKVSEARRLLAKRELARRRLLEFTKITHPRYLPGWVHDDISRRLERFSEQVANGEGPRLMLLVPPRHGKALALSTQIPTPRGMVTYGHLRVGDYVFAPSGDIIEVTAVGQDLPVDMKVTFSNGATIVCHELHEWMVNGKRVETRNLRKGMRMPSTRCLDQWKKSLPLDPYFLGLWLGDGVSSEATICGSKEDLEEELSHVDYELGAKWVNSRTGVVYQYFKGVSHLLPLNDKHIPEIYFLSDEEDRRALLAGLIDSDGHVGERVRFRNTNERLAHGVLRLACSLGYRASMSLQKVPGYKDCYTVGWASHDGQGGGRLARKQIKKVVGRRPPVCVMSVERVEPVTGRCIEVEDGEYLVGPQCVPTHNSELSSIRFPAWHLGKHPHHEIINVGYNTELPNGFSRKVREILRSPEYQGIFPACRLDPETQAVEHWRTTAGGSFTTAGRGGGVTGKGAHILIVDDPIKDQQEADSQLVRDQLMDWYQSVAYTRLAPGGGMLLIQTWWNDDDLAGRLQTAMTLRGKPGFEDVDMFEVIKYPALSTQYEYRDDSVPGVPGEIVRLDSPQDMAGFTLLRAKDECLHRDRYDEKALRRIRGNLQPRIWSALYQQNPVPDEGMYFRRDDFVYHRQMPTVAGNSVYTAWDFAIAEKTNNDWTVGVTIMQDQHDQLFVLDVVRIKGDSFQIVEAILDTAMKYSGPQNGYLLGVESGQIWLAIKPLLEKRMSERGQFVAYEALKPLTDKMARARPLQGRLQQGRVIFPEGATWLPTVEQEMLRFPAGAHDDIVDALAWAVRLSLDKPPPTPPEPPPQKSWRDSLGSFGQGDIGHMAA